MTYAATATTDMEKETISIELAGTSKYGGYVKANGEFYSLNEGLGAEDFQKGGTYTILFRRGKPSAQNPGGKKYIQQIVASEAKASSAPSPSAPVVSKTTDKDVAPVYHITSGFGKPMTQYEIDKDRRISRAGVIQAAAQSPAVAGLKGSNTPDGLAKNTVEYAQKLLEWVEAKA